MAGIQICTLVLEYNYSRRPSDSLGTVWLCNGDGTSDLFRDESLEIHPQWIKIVGPIQLDDASAIHAALKKFFEENGVSVIDEGIAD
jgi:hypothetical protein